MDKKSVPDCLRPHVYFYPHTLYCVYELQRKANNNKMTQNKNVILKHFDETKDHKFPASDMKIQHVETLPNYVVPLVQDSIFLSYVKNQEILRCID